MDAIVWTERIARTRSRMARLRQLSVATHDPSLLVWLEAEERMLQFLLERH